MNEDAEYFSGRFQRFECMKVGKIDSTIFYSAELVCIEFKVLL